MTQADRTAGAGTDHWRRAVMWTFAGIFVVALAGGLVGGLTGGTGALAVPGHLRPGAAPRPSTNTAPAAALLTLSDLPSGWEAGGAAAAPTRTSPWSRELASCVGVPSSVAALRPTSYSSPDFTSANRQLAVEDTVSVYPSAPSARAGYSALASARTPGCMDAVGGAALRQSIEQQAGTGTTVGTVAFAALPATAHAAHQAGFSVTIPLVSDGRELLITSTQIDVVEGTQVRQLTFNGNGTVFPALLEEQLVEAALARH